MNVNPEQKQSKKPQPIATTSSQPCIKPHVISRLSSRQLWVYNHLKNFCVKDGWISPTYIGNQYGIAVLGRKGCHSSTGSPILKELVNIGLVEKNNKGHYRLVSNGL